MTKPVQRVAVTGGAGQIAYSLLFRIATGEMLGYDQPVALHILEIPPALGALEGVVMELKDCAFPLLQDIKVGSDPYELFGDVDYALLVGSKPRGPGMERGELLTENGKIFITQGDALNQSASRDVKVLVVGNPCNTNCWIAMNHAKDLPRENFHAMTRLDHNRGMAQLAMKANCPVSEVTNMTIWGNHSSTQVPDFFHAKIGGKPAMEVIQDVDWFESTFIPKVQGRGAEIIKARGKSSAASAANAAIDAIKSLITPTPEGDWYSSAICSDGNPYGIADDLMFSFPCRTTAEGKVEIVKDVNWNDFLSGKIRASERELMDEKDCVADLMQSAT